MRIGNISGGHIGTMTEPVAGFVQNIKLVKLVLRIMELPDKTIGFERLADRPEGYGYPLADDYLGPEAPAELARLGDEALLERVFITKEFGCPKCRSIDLSLHLHCPNCDGVKIGRQEIIEHVACGWQGAKSQAVDDRCPKCGDPLRKIGVDYVSQGAQFACENCGNVFQAPIQKLTCTRDHSNFTVTDAAEIPLYNYRLTTRLEDEINRAIDQQKYIQEKIKTMGFKTRSPAVITGHSGIEQQFYLAATSGIGFFKVLIVVELISNGSIDEILSLYAKALDVKANGVVIAAIPSLSEKSKQLAASYGMPLVEARDLSSAAERLVEKFGELVQSPEEELVESLAKPEQSEGFGPPKAA